MTSLELGGLGLNCTTLAPLGRLRSLALFNASHNVLGAIDLVRQASPANLSQVYIRESGVGSGYDPYDLAYLLVLPSLLELDVGGNGLAGGAPEGDAMDTVTQLAD